MFENVRKIFLFYMLFSLLPLYAVDIKNIPRKKNGKHYSLMHDSIRFAVGITLLVVSFLCLEKSYHEVAIVLGGREGEAVGSYKAWLSFFKKRPDPLFAKNDLLHWQDFLSSGVSTVGWGTLGLLTFKVAYSFIKDGFDN